MGENLPSDMKVRVLKTVQGSGPFGEVQADSKIFTLERHPPALALGSTLPTPDLPPMRRDVDIGPGGLAFVIENILSPEEADLLASVSERVGYSRFAPAIRTPPGMRQNKAAHWLASEDTAEAFLRPLYKRFQHLLPQSLGGAALHDELSHRVAHYKYEDGDVFNRHTDGCWPGQSVAKSGNNIEEWPNVESKLTMLLYLNDAQDGVHGGQTRLFPFGNADPVDVAPLKGGALFFRHGFEGDSVMHMGTRVSGSIPKYVVRLNVLYREFA